MKFSTNSRIISLLLLLIASTNTYAQTEPTLIEMIERHLAVPLDDRKSLDIPGNVRIDIPLATQKNMRFEFEKRMAVSGHGVLYDAAGRQVELELPEIFKLQEQILSAVRTEKEMLMEGQEKARDALSDITAKIQESLRSNRLDDANRFFLHNLLTRAQSFKLDDTRREAYQWRTAFLLNSALRLELKLLPEFIIVEGSLIDWWTEWFFKTGYMRDCEAAGVPVPPNLDVNDPNSEWSFQGQLTTKLIAATQDANVWTWHETGERGACVALPRGSGGAGSLAGVICQSAVTGNACFWDNLPKGSTTRIPWATQQLVIRNLQDGSELNENCTNCHRGNNVFLVSPDDPTWCRLLRGQSSSSCAAMDGSDISNYTLAVEGNVRTVNVPNTSIHHSRYTPMSGTPSRPGWVNNESIGCGGACHLGGSAVTPPPMPPACGVNCK